MHFRMCLVRLVILSKHVLVFLKKQTHPQPKIKKISPKLSKKGLNQNMKINSQMLGTILPMPLVGAWVFR